jgi:hypothetical protein
MHACQRKRRVRIHQHSINWFNNMRSIGANWLSFSSVDTGLQQLADTWNATHAKGAANNNIYHMKHPEHLAKPCKKWKHNRISRKKDAIQEANAEPLLNALQHATMSLLHCQLDTQVLKKKLRRDKVRYLQ